MARQTSVNDRTIRRDLKLFVDAGIPLRETVGARSKKIWRIDPRGTMVRVSDSGDEALALLLAEKLFEPWSETRFYLAIKRCLDQVASALSAPNRARLDEQSKNLHITVQHTAEALATSVVIDEVWQALAAGKPVNVSWRGALSHTLQSTASELERAS